MIDISQLEISFDAKPVLRKLNAQFALGKVHGIIGLNGAGKTTFFNALATYLKPQGGSIVFNGNALKRTDITFLETHNYFYPGLTGNDYLKIFDTTNTDFSLDGLQQLFQLPLNDLIENYSTGMKKKLALLAILKQDKPIYLFDEPFNGLDMETNKVMELIIEALKAKGKTLFISSHILSPLLHTCTQIHLLAEGVFKQTYEREHFAQIDEDLFRIFTGKAQDIVSSSL
jgi:ABC-2 type transport system ATP-binding protein